MVCINVFDSFLFVIFQFGFDRGLNLYSQNEDKKVHQKYNLFKYIHENKALTSKTLP